MRDQAWEQAGDEQAGHQRPLRRIRRPRLQLCDCAGDGVDPGRRLGLRWGGVEEFQAKVSQHRPADGNRAGERHADQLRGSNAHRGRPRQQRRHPKRREAPREGRARETDFREHRGELHERRGDEDHARARREVAHQPGKQQRGRRDLYGEHLLHRDCARPGPWRRTTAARARPRGPGLSVE